MEVLLIFSLVLVLVVVAFIVVDFVLDEAMSTETPVAIDAAVEEGVTLPKATGAIEKGDFVYFDEEGYITKYSTKEAEREAA